MPRRRLLQGGMHLGFMFLPIYRGWVVVASLTVCLATWYVIERTRWAPRCARPRERPDLVQALGINVPVLVTATYATGVALAAFAGVLARTGDSR
jgi:branched-chain amino acid transport system permease protein